MNIQPFALERYFAKHEFTARYLLCSSDCEAVGMQELLAMADEESARLWAELKLGYTETSGHPLLRQEIAGLYAGLGADDTLVMAPEEAIYLLMHALLEPGDHVVCTFPGYQSLYQVALSLGCQVSRWQPDERRGWHFDVEQLESLLQANTRLLVFNFPHNPTGAMPTRDEFERIVALARQRGIWLLSDEMYRYLEIEPGTTLPAACELYERAFSLFGLSKTFGMPGLRMGWLASRDAEALRRVAVLKDYTTICNSAPAEILALIALRNRETIIARQLRRLRHNLGALDDFFDRHVDQFKWNRPKGGSIGFVRMLAVGDSYQFCEQLVQESGILLAPSRLFDYGDQHVRIGFGRQNLPQVLERFEDYLAAWKTNQKNRGMMSNTLTSV
jgi:aspartate/methionine/tyrosine aminotransferase